MACGIFGIRSVSMRLGVYEKGETAMRFNQDDLHELTITGGERTDPNNGRCPYCKHIMWYTHLVLAIDGGFAHESCLTMKRRIADMKKEALGAFTWDGKDNG